MVSRPKWESDLIAISRKSPHWAAIAKEAADLHWEKHDRSIAVAVGSLVEHMLRLCIRENMTELTPNEEKTIFEGPNSPLGTLSARIQIAYALRLYGRKTRKELDLACCRFG